MKKTLLGLTLLLLVMMARAQTPYIVISGGSAAFPSGSYYPNSLPITGSTVFTNNTAWTISFFASDGHGGYYYENFTTNSSGPSGALLNYNISSAFNFPYGYSAPAWYSTPTPVPTFTFYNFSPAPTAPVYSTALTNFWPANGGIVSLSAAGVTTSNNFLTLSVNSNLIFTSAATQTNGALWQLQGTLTLDASSNLTAAIAMTGNGVGGAAFTTLTNVSRNNVTFALGESGAGDTNLTVTSVQIAGQQAVGGVQPVLNWPAASTGGSSSSSTNSVLTLSNSVLSSQQFTVFSSNYWTFGTSNYIGRFTNGWSKINFSGGHAGGGGLALPTNVFEQMWASANGTSGWFVLTNFSNNTNTYSLAVVGAGGGLGSLIIQTIDHPEYIGRTNGFYGQFTQFSDPLTPQDAATKNYVDFTEQNMAAGQWQNMTDTNNYFHQIVSHYGATVFDIGFPTTTLYNSLSIDGTGTNLLLAIPQTNLPAFFVISSSTNLLLLNGWTTYTNYTVATNSGIVTFTIPIYPAQPEMFFWPRSAATPTANLYASLTIGSAFSLWVQTNTPTISDLGNQKGGREWCSNGFFFVTGSTNGTTVYTRQIAP